MTNKGAPINYDIGISADKDKKKTRRIHIKAKYLITDDKLVIEMSKWKHINIEEKIFGSKPKYMRMPSRNAYLNRLEIRLLININTTLLIQNLMPYVKALINFIFQKLSNHK